MRATAVESLPVGIEPRVTVVCLPVPPAAGVDSAGIVNRCKEGYA